MAAKPIATAKVLRGLESAYTKKTAELDAALKRIAQLEAKLEKQK